MKPIRNSLTYLVLTIFVSVSLLAGCRQDASQPEKQSTSDPASTRNTPPKTGDPAPSFEATDHNGDPWALSDHTGEHPVVLYFYPAALTSGCTKQACSFRDRMASLNDLEATVVGISGDEVRNLPLFRNAHGLEFTLLSDPDGSVARKFGVPVGDGGTIERTVDGMTHTLRRGATFERWTFIMNRDGKIVYRDTEVTPEKDARSVIQVLKKLDSTS